MEFAADKSSEPLMLSVMAVLVSSMAGQTPLLVPNSAPVSLAIIAAPGTDPTPGSSLDLQSRIRNLLQGATPLHYSPDSVILPLVDADFADRPGEMSLESALVRVQNRRQPSQSLLIVIDAHCQWNDGELGISFPKSGETGGRPMLPLTRFIELVDRVRIRGKCVVLALSTDSAVSTEEFVRFVRLGRLWNARTFPSHWVVVTFNRNDIDPSKSVEARVKLLEALAGAADRDHGVDGYVTIRELAAWILESAKFRRGAAFVWRSNHPGASEEASSFPTTPIAVNPLGLKQRDAAIREIDGQERDGQLDHLMATEGRRLFEHMPEVALDRSLRKSFGDYLDRRTSLANLCTIRNRILADRTLPVPEARQFAMSVTAVDSLARSKFVRPKDVRLALRSALESLLAQMAETETPELRKNLDELESMSEGNLFDLLMQIRMRLGRRDSLKDRRAADLCMKAFADALDNYSDYFTPTQFAEEKKQSEGQFTGVGLKLLPAKRGGLEVDGVIPNSVAHKNGIVVGDRIIRINNKSLNGVEFDVAADLLMGRRGQNADLLVERPGVAGNLQFRLVYERVKLETVFGWRRRHDLTPDFWFDRPKRIGYVRISMFSDDTAEQMRHALVQLRNDNANSMILDLRDNPGGVLGTAIETASLFVGNATVVTIVDGQGRRKPCAGAAFGSFREIPLAVIVNRNSASGAELVAAALADCQRAKIVGERTYGKGSVQTIFELEAGLAGFKLTTQLFERPNGKNLNRFSYSRDVDSWGVLPDPEFSTHFSAREMDSCARRFAHDATVVRSSNVTLIANDRGVALAVQSLANPIVPR